VTAFLFDLDGTLLDSTALLLAGYQHTTRTILGRETTKADWLPLFGLPLRDQFAAFEPSLAAEMVVEYRRFYAEHHDAMMAVYPGAVEAVRALHAAGHPCGVVTSKLTKFAQRAVDTFGLTECFGAVVGEDMVTRHKPHPDAVLKACEMLGVNPVGAWMIGDSPFDIQAGRAAGCRTAAVLWGPFTRERLEPSRPDVWLPSPREILRLA
jgi:pyrophosphatase PpaX